MALGVAGGLERRARLRETLATIYYLRSMLSEIEDALQVARRAGTGKAYIGVSGGVMIEVPLDEAIKYLERRKAAIEALLKKLEEDVGGR